MEARRLAQITIGPKKAIRACLTARLTGSIPYPLQRLTPNISPIARSYQISCEQRIKIQPCIARGFRRAGIIDLASMYPAFVEFVVPRGIMDNGALATSTRVLPPNFPPPGASV
jgi:hypothetical protein